MNSQRPTNPALTWLENATPQQRLTLFRLYERAIHRALEAEAAKEDENTGPPNGSAIEENQIGVQAETQPITDTDYLVEAKV